MHETSIQTGDLEIIYRFEVTPKTLGQITAIAGWRGFIHGLETFEHFDFGDLERNHEIEEAVASVCIEGASINVKEAQTLMENEEELDMDALNKSQKELVAYLEAKKMFCITEYYNRNRDRYYDALQCVEVIDKTDGRLVLDASKWLKYFLGGLAYQIVAAQKRVQTLVEKSQNT
jgi:hypothetical protein